MDGEKVSLALCPCCGGQPQIWDDSEDWICACTNRDCPGEPGCVGNSTRAEAVAKWNTRAPPPTDKDAESRDYRRGIEDAAKWHEAESRELRERLARERGRRHFSGYSGSLGGRAVEISGNHLNELRAALEDEINSHEIAAKAIRALPGDGRAA